MADNTNLRITTKAPAPPHDGDVYYDPVQQVEFIYAGGAWQPINAAASGLSQNPTFATVTVTDSETVANAFTVTTGPVTLPSSVITLKVADRGGQVFNITSSAYGAIAKTSDGDTSHNVRSIIQQALDDAKAAGGGIVWVPWSQYGWYCGAASGDRLDVWTGCTLRGRWPGLGTYERTSSLAAEYKYRGSELHTSANSGSTSATLSFITVHRNAKVEGISVFYPDQTSTNPPISYPPAMQFSVDATGKYGGGAITEVCLVNPYIGISAVSHDNFTIDKVTGQPLFKGITVDDCHNTPWIKNVLFWQVWQALGTAPNIDAYMLASATAFEFLDVDEIQFDNLFSFGYHTGFVLGAATGTDGYGQGTNLGVDGCQRGIVYQGGNYPWQLSNVNIISTSGALGVARGILCTGGDISASGELQIGKCMIECSNGTGVEMQSSAHQPLKISQGRFHDWNASGAAILTSSTDADIIVSDSNFWHATGPHLDISALTSAATAYISLDNCRYKNQGRNISTGASNPAVRGVRLSGLASPSAVTSLVVTHNLGVSVLQITVTPITVDAVNRFWVTAISKTQFTLNFPSSTTANLYWTVAGSAD